jgi:hypothetical protein
MDRTMERRKLIAICVPGEMFSQKWMFHWTALLTQLPPMGFDLMPVWAYTSCPAATRAALVIGVRELWAQIEVDYVLWLDHDNLVTPENVANLVSDVDVNPDALVAGWTWIDKEDGPEVSNGLHTPRLTNLPSLPRDMKVSKLVPRDYTGFPVVLHKPELLNVCMFPFAPIPNEHSRSGANGEDTSFCIRLKQAGKRILIDPAVYVPHLKTREVPGPVNEVEPVDLMGVVA